MFRRKGSRCVARFEAYEVRALRQVAAEVVALLTDGFDQADPVVERLFPAVYPDDPASTADLRQYMDGELKTAKIDQAGAILAALPNDGGTEVSLDEEAADDWLRALNDVRLALGIRLDVRDDMDLEEELDDAVLRDPTSPRVGQLELYGYLGLLQQSLLEALTA
ncbi:MAG TPA: DUF2017 family protein [Micromonosporaceae bacterium]|nr:DUF2017 family protein [Micromonosporaceae bacterium]